MATTYFTKNNIDIKIVHHENMYFIERIYIKDLIELKNQNFIEIVYEIPLSTGKVAKKVVNRRFITVSRDTKYKQPSKPNYDIDEKLEEIRTKKISTSTTDNTYKSSSGLVKPDK